MSMQFVRLQLDIEIDLQEDDIEEIDEKLVAKQVEFQLEANDIYHQEITDWMFGGHKSMIENVTAEVL